MNQGRNHNGNWKYFQLLFNNETISYQNLGDAAKAVIRGTFIALVAHIRKERCAINVLYFYLKKYRKKSKLNPKQGE